MQKTSLFFYYIWRMKKFITVLFISLVAFCDCYAQKYQPRETWPYVNDEFVDGAVRTRSGSLIEEAKLNVSVADGSLHYIKDGVIMKIDMSTVYTARIGFDVFVNVGAKMYRILSEKESGCLLQFMQIDIDKMGRVDIGYGISSSSASAMNINSLDGLTDTVNYKVEKAMDDKDTGEYLPLIVERFFLIDGKLIPATKQGLKDYPGIDMNALDAFVKSNKIKWTKNESLELLVDFVAAQLANN